MNATKKQFIINILLILLCIVVGIGLIVGGSFIKKGNDKKIAEWTHVTGTVVDYTSSKDMDDDIMYSEIVEYEVGGVKYRLKSSSSSNVRPQTGKKREVAYDPAKPERAIIVSENRLMTTIMFIVGSVFTAIGALLIVSSVLKGRKKNAPEIAPESISEPSMPEPPQSEQPAPSGRYVFTGSAPPAQNQSATPSGDNPFEEFDTKDR